MRNNEHLLRMAVVPSREQLSGPNPFNMISYESPVDLSTTLGNSSAPLDLTPFKTQTSQNPFLQALEVMFSEKPFTKTDFIDINAQSASGLITPLHMAVLLNDKTLCQKLIECGAKLDIQNIFGNTPLRLAIDNSHTEIVQTILDFKLAEQDEILKFSDFTLFKAKNDGITFGGFYHDENQGSWLLKDGHYGEKSVAIEYVAGGLYQLFLGNNTPQTEIVIDDHVGRFLTGSKLLEGFKTLHDLDSRYSENSFYGDLSHYSLSYNGKEVTNFFDGISAVIFMGDSDAHGGNVGLIDHGDYYSFAKIDHGFSFNFYSQQTLSLDDFRYHLKSFYQIEKIENFGFDEVYNSISKISDMNFSKIEDVTLEKFSNVKTHMDILDLPSFKNSSYDHFANQNELPYFQDNLVSNLKSQHDQFQKIADFMQLEKAIIDHDPIKLLEMVENGTSLEQPFKPFFNPIYKEHMGWGVETKSVTGLELINKNWPNIVDSFIEQKDKLNLSIEDIIAYDDNIHLPNNDSPVYVNAPIPAASCSAPPIVPHIELHQPVHIDFA